MTISINLTLAISLQLFPASRMAFNRCSSAGVHGVFVLLFFGADIGEIVSACCSLCCGCAPYPVGLPYPDAGMDDMPAAGAAPGALRFLGFGGLACSWLCICGCDGGCGASKSSSGRLPIGT